MIGTGELIVMLCVILVLFGGKKLPELARSIGLGIREFKKACNGIDDDINEKPKNSSSKNQTEPVTLIVEPENKDK